MGAQPSARAVRRTAGGAWRAATTYQLVDVALVQREAEFDELVGLRRDVGLEPAVRLAAHNALGAGVVGDSQQAQKRNKSKHSKTKKVAR